MASLRLEMECSGAEIEVLAEVKTILLHLMVVTEPAIHQLQNVLPSCHH